MRRVLTTLVLCLIPLPLLANDPPPAPKSDVPTINGTPVLPSDINLPAPPAHDLPAPGTPPPRGSTISAPPAPPNPTWKIVAYRWISGGWVKQPDHCLETTNVKQAADYCLVLDKFQDWYYQSNVPLGCCDPSVQAFASVPGSAPVPGGFPGLTLSVWAFKFAGGKWIKDETYSWTSSADYFNLRPDMLAYAKKVNAIPGWCATTNAPDCVRQDSGKASLPVSPQADAWAASA